jgi:predicted Rossmann-fold nucleotide-binding protein
MKFLVLGSGNREKAARYGAQAEELGTLLAANRHVLVASPSTGIQGLVAKAYKSAGGHKFIGYYPDLSDMEAYGEKALLEPDVKVMTGECYPIRNILQARASDAAIVMTGGRSTLTEALTVVDDIKIPLGYYEGSSPLLDKFISIDPSIKEAVYVSSDIAHMVRILENEAKSRQNLL